MARSLSTKVFTIPFDTGHNTAISDCPSIKQMEVMATKVHAMSRPPGPAVFMTSPPVENAVVVVGSSMMSRSRDVSNPMAASKQKLKAERKDKDEKMTRKEFQSL